MQLDKLCVACFSPTHTSMKIARAIADGTRIARREEIDLTTDVPTRPSRYATPSASWPPPSTGDLWPR